MDELEQVKRVVETHLLPELNVKHTLKGPLFVIGHARSGTTIVGNMIRKYLQVNFGPESQFFFRLQKDLPRYGDLSVTDNYRALVTDIAAERCFALNQFGFKIDVEETVAHGTRTYPGAIEYIYRRYAEHNGMSRWGDKTPLYLEDLPALHALFPDAQYVHVVRDGRDVALSNFEVFFGANNAVTAADEWQRAIHLADAFIASVPERCTTVYYEKFLDNPVQELTRLQAFLGVCDADGRVQEAIRSGVQNELSAGNYGKWRTRFSMAQQRRFERVAGSTLRKHGYTCLHDELVPPGRVYVSVWWWLHFLRKYTKLRAWQDNVYALKVRTRSLLKRLR